MEIYSNFVIDYANTLRKQLVKVRALDRSLVKKLKTMEVNYIILLGINLALYLINPMPRLVLLAKNFKCPDQYLDVFNGILERVKKGDTVIPYQRKYKPIKGRQHNPDYMLYDWGIYHFHLSNVESNGMHERTEDLLFVFINNDYFCPIAIGCHDSFNAQDLFEEVHRNWAFLIEKYRILGASGEGVKRYDSTQLLELRKAGIQPPFFKMSDGVVYYSINGGYSTDGSNTNAVLYSSHIIRELKNIEEHSREYIFSFYQDILKISLPPSVELSMMLLDGRILIKESNSNQAWGLLLEEPPLFNLLLNHFS